MTDRSVQANQALAAARQALHQGNRRLARRYIETALALAPDLEEAWLMLAAVASPEASLAYLRRALEINPHSQRAREGMRWALKRQRAAPERRTRPQVVLNLPAQAITYKRRPLLPWLLLILVVAAGLVAWYEAVPIQMALALAEGNPPGRPAAYLVKPTLTPTPTNTPTPTPTPTNTPTPTATPTETPTPLPTDTPVPTPVPEDVSAPDQKAPLERPADEFWIDVDLTNQSAYAYQGTELLRSFVVSTGTWLHPTLTGEYKIYVKYRYADMAGPGYYLPDVPYVMYYDRGYGLHGTYWHSNFGTPMSHGCINFRTEDAGWIFSRASVGTLVNIHY